MHGISYIALILWSSGMKRLQHGICRSHVLVFAREKNCTTALSIIYVALFCGFIALEGDFFSFKTGGGMGMRKGKGDMCHRWYDALK